MRLLKNTLKAIVFAAIIALMMVCCAGIFYVPLMWVPFTTIFVGGILIHTYPDIPNKFIEW